MRINCCFPLRFNGLRPRIPTAKWGLPCALVLAALSLQAPAFALDVQVAGGSGGRVAIVPGDTDCALDCRIQVPPYSLLSLFALPDQDYRFQGWNGACAGTLGPLCTLRAGEHIGVSANFARAEMPQAPAKALLLLHGEGARHTVWNELVKQHFNNRCPVIYGGVVLGEDSFDPRNNVYCYRIAFGYYDMLNHNIAAKALQKAGDTTKTSGKHLGYEVRAAVLGLLNRHPELSLTLVGQARAALAAQSFLQAGTGEGSRVIGVLALQQSSYDSEQAIYGQFETWLSGRIAVRQLEAGPEQDGKISAALGGLTKSWWMSR